MEQNLSKLPQPQTQRGNNTVEQHLSKLSKLWIQPVNNGTSSLKADIASDTAGIQTVTAILSISQLIFKYICTVLNT